MIIEKRTRLSMFIEHEKKDKAINVHKTLKKQGYQCSLNIKKGQDNQCLLIIEKGQGYQY